MDIFLTTTESKEKEKENLIFVSHSDSIIVYSFLEKNESIQQKVYLTYSSICNFYQLGSSLLLGVDSYEGFDGNNKNVLIEFGYRTQNSDNFYINCGIYIAKGNEHNYNGGITNANYAKKIAKETKI